jgi:hypothetical protein
LGVNTYEDERRSTIDDQPEETSENNAYLEGVKQAITSWRNQKPSLLSNVMGAAGAPVAFVVNKLIPHKAIEGALIGVDWIAKQRLNRDSDCDFSDLASCDRRAHAVRTTTAIGATAEGGLAGFFGLIGMAADIPAITLAALLTIRQVGFQYGFTNDNDAERMFVFSVLSAAGANSQGEKNEALLTGALLRNTLKQTWKAMASKAATEKVSAESVLIAVRGLAKQLGINLTKRKALAAIPVIGAAVGAGTNLWFINDVGEAAQRCYQERWLRDRDLLIDEDEVLVM